MGELGPGLRKRGGRRVQGGGGGGGKEERGEGGRRKRVGEGIKRDGFEEATTYGNHGILFIALVLAYHFETLCTKIMQCIYMYISILKLFIFSYTCQMFGNHIQLAGTMCTTNFHYNYKHSM